jgi:hypothetical protein
MGRLIDVDLSYWGLLGLVFRDSADAMIEDKNFFGTRDKLKDQLFNSGVILGSDRCIGTQINKIQARDFNRSERMFIYAEVVFDPSNISNLDLHRLVGYNSWCQSHLVQ